MTIKRSFYNPELLDLYYEIQKIAGQKEDLVKKLKELYPAEFSANLNLESSINKIVEDKTILSWIRTKFAGRTQVELHSLNDSIQTLEIYFPVRNSINGKLSGEDSEEFIKTIIEKEPFKKDPVLPEKESTTRNIATAIKSLQPLNIDHIQAILDIFFRGKVSINPDAQVDEGRERVGKVGEWNIWLPHTKDTSAKIAGYNPVTLEPTTTWCTARTMGSNLFYNYIGRHDYTIFLFYIIKDNPQKKMPEKIDNDWMSIGFVGSAYGKEPLKPDFSGKNGGLTVNRSNQGLVEDDFINTLGQEVWSEVKSMMERKMDSLDRKNPAREIIVNMAKNLVEFEKELSKKSVEEKKDFCEIILSSKPRPDVFEYIADFYTRSNPEDFLSEKSRFKDMVAEGLRSKSGKNYERILKALRSLSKINPSHYLGDSFCSQILSRVYNINPEYHKESKKIAVVSSAEKDPQFFWKEILKTGYRPVDSDISDVVTFDLIVSALRKYAKEKSSDFLADESRIRGYFGYLPKQVNLTPEQAQTLQSLEKEVFHDALVGVAEESPYTYFSRNYHKDPANDEISKVAAKSLAIALPSMYMDFGLDKSPFATQELNEMAMKGMVEKAPASFFEKDYYKNASDELILFAWKNLAERTPDAFLTQRKKFIDQNFNFQGRDDESIIRTALKNISLRSLDAAKLLTSTKYQDAISDLGLDISAEEKQATQTLLNSPIEYFNLPKLYKRPDLWKDTLKQFPLYIEQESAKDQLDSLKTNGSFSSALKYVNNSTLQTPEDEEAIVNINKAFLEKTHKLLTFTKESLASVVNIISSDLKRKDRLASTELDRYVFQAAESLINRERFNEYNDYIIKKSYASATICFAELPIFKDLNLVFYKKMFELYGPLNYARSFSSPFKYRPEYRDILIAAYQGIAADTKNLDANLSEFATDKVVGFAHVKKLNDPTINEIITGAAMSLLDSLGPDKYLQKAYGKVTTDSQALLFVIAEAQRRLNPPASLEDNQPSNLPDSQSMWINNKLNKLARSLSFAGTNSDKIRLIIRKLAALELDLDIQDWLKEEDSNWVEYSAQGPEERSLADWWQSNAVELPGNYTPSLDSFKDWYETKLTTDWQGVDKSPNEVIDILLHEMDPLSTPAPVVNTSPTTPSSDLATSEAPDAIKEGTVTKNRWTDLSRITPELSQFINELGKVAKEMGAGTPHITSAFRPMETTARYIIKNWVSNGRSRGYLTRLYGDSGRNRRGAIMADILEQYGAESPEAFNKILEVVKTMKQGHSAGKVVDLRLTDRIKEVLDAISASGKFKMSITDETWTAGPHYHVFINGVNQS